MLMTIIKGMMIGFAFVAPIGMQNLYVFNNALTNSFRRSLVYVLFVWIADSLFSLAAFFGMGAIISSVTWLRLLVMLVGGLLVIWIGWGILRSADGVQLNAHQNKLPVKQAFMTAFIVSWANPQALIDGSLLLGALRGTLTKDAVWPFIIGVIMATFIWFNTITILMNLLKERLPKKVLVWVNIISGLIVLIYGAYLLVEALLDIF
ncbi:LysE/ArgO family amino acid transporter [Weissella paramesenteroides]|uniref:LysE/ArgO family amino acid transporter n=1 Tax=Weissella paramesenteroides TaxID=1249 RepID=UPI002074445F|nr:LysE family transporter [Weissella paramesenteroides]MCM6766091.1 LysE family transporter [Weissella paramesenteroides]MCM6767467.1 LysE family transporter [Weissella paramesenteroides]MCM6769720.1 LysE family transporter [Weissella paramesenteroides]MCM6770182.1 LysE family transporter [Weissella paramesenteroides]MCM6780105.1 LysE family transporter [Weissella paramesenteroides]